MVRYIQRVIKLKKILVKRRQKIMAKKDTIAKLLVNPAYDASTADEKQTGKYLFDAGDGSEAAECWVWLEKSKANDKHPNGKPWIRCKKMEEVCNRQYFSEDLFLDSDKGEGVEVEVRTAPPRVIGATGVNKTVIKYLDDETAAEYTTLVEDAIEAFKEAKEAAKGKKPEDMSIEELEAYIAALKAGEKPSLTGLKTFIDMFTEEQYERYNEIIAISAENKANTPRKSRKLTEEEKAERAEKRRAKEISKAEELLAQLRAMGI